jgi:hypothetical protein
MWSELVDDNIGSIRGTIRTVRRSVRVADDQIQRGRPMRRTIALLALLSVTAVPLTAQARAPQWQSWRPPVTATDPRSSAQSASSTGTAMLVLAGIGGGTVGVVAGGLVGWELAGGNTICGDDACGLAAGAYGAIIGESTLLPLAVHLANHSRGNYWLSLLASAGIGAAGVLAVDGANDGWPLAGIPILQILSSIVIERSTSH